MTQLKVKVLQHHIDAAVAYGFHSLVLHCPISLALNEQYPEHAPWETGNASAHAADSPDVYQLDDEGLRIRRWFDDFIMSPGPPGPPLTGEFTLQA